MTISVASIDDPVDITIQNYEGLEDTPLDLNLNLTKYDSNDVEVIVTLNATHGSFRIPDHAIASIAQSNSYFINETHFMRFMAPFLNAQKIIGTIQYIGDLHW